MLALNVPVAFIFVEPFAVPINVPASCNDDLEGTTLILYSVKATSEVKLNVATFLGAVLEILETSGPIIVTAGTEVSNVIVADAAAVSLQTSSRTFTYTVLSPSPVGSAILFVDAKVSHEALSSDDAPSIPPNLHLITDSRCIS